MTPDEKALYDLMTRENAEAPFPFCPTEFWTRETNKFEVEFDTKGIGDPSNSFWNSRFHGTKPDDPWLYHWFLSAFAEALKSRDTLGLLTKLETGIQAERLPVVGDLGTPIRADGQELHADFLFSIHDFYNLMEVLPGIATEPLIIGDLGAGWGRLGHIIAQTNPNATYCVFDIPAGLAVSSSVLPRMLPGVSVCNYLESRGHHVLDHEALSQKRVWILGSQDLLRIPIGTLDAIVNVACFQEMPIDQVNAYLKIFNQVSKTVYLRNNAYQKNELSEPKQYDIPSSWRTLFNRPCVLGKFLESGYRLVD